MSISAILAASHANDQGDDIGASMTSSSSFRRSKKGIQALDAHQILKKHRDALLKLQETWSPARLAMYNRLRHPLCESVLAVCITFNMVLVILEAEQIEGEWQTTAQNVLLGIYIAELLLKIYTFQTDFFRGDLWNGIDFAVVAVDVVSLLMSAFGLDMLSFSFLRIFRLAKLARTVKLAKGFQELNQLLQGFLGAMKAIFWGVLMIFMMMTVWAIVAVNFINPLTLRVATNTPTVYENCERCHRAFSTVGSSITTFFQTLVAGDSWGEVAVPIIEEEPLAFTFFVGVLVTVQLVMLNLILALIVEAAVQATAAQKHKDATQKQAEMDNAEISLLQMCSEIDTSKSGNLSLSDFIEGFKHNADFAECMKNMDVSEADIGMIFTICDEDRSGTVDYEEFVMQLRRMKSRPSELILYYITEVRGMMNDVTRNLALHSTLLEELSCGEDRKPVSRLDGEAEEATDPQKQQGVAKQEKQRQEREEVMDSCLAAPNAERFVHVHDVDVAFASAPWTPVAEATLQEEKDAPSKAWNEGWDESLRGLEAIRDALSDYLLLLQRQQASASVQELASSLVKAGKETKLHAIKAKKRTTPRDRQDACAATGDRGLNQLADSTYSGAEFKAGLSGRQLPCIGLEDHRPKITKACFFPGAAIKHYTGGSGVADTNATASRPG
eukprot:TRINITY_DN11825_c0_g2_i1.p1 TRINITY_DN11825_c0_g2~~TRINITY_DN11825_c0_g2_i1.p1  ORF type:complete len:670 (+),score=122.26 TRINITY_DN11825_c0_g2_i1:77-2086(+)